MNNPYPNPFDYSTNIRFNLRARSQISFDVYNFNNELILDDVYSSENEAGYWLKTVEFSDILPSGGYRLVLNINESDTSYSIEKNILQTFTGYGHLILNTKENAETVNGVFKILYSKMPFGEQFIRTGPSGPDPFYQFGVGSKVKLVIYKPGYKVALQDVIVDLEEGQEVNIQLEIE